MRNALLILCAVFTLLVSCNSADKKNKETTQDSIATVQPIEETRQISEIITRFVRAYKSKDNQKVNKLIHPDLGLYVIYRPGAMDTYEHVDSLDFEKPVPNHFPYSAISNDYALTFDSLPAFDCGTNKWNKFGLICDTVNNANQLAYIAEFKHEFEEITDQELVQIKEIEQNSYRVILTGGDNLIFHIKKHEGSWYLFVLDRAYGWCDA